MTDPALPSPAALHEAAHAVAAKHLGARVVSFSIEEVDIAPPLDPHTRAVIAFAGAVANGRQNPHGRGDIEQLRESGLVGRELAAARDEARGIVAGRWPEIVALAREIDRKAKVSA